MILFYFGSIAFMVCTCIQLFLQGRDIDQLKGEVRRLDDLDTVSSIRIANLESYVKELREKAP